MSRDPDFVMARVNAMDIECAYCGAEPDRECYDPRTGFVLENQPAHYRRLQDAHVL